MDMYVPVPHRLSPQRSGSVHVSMHPDENRSASCCGFKKFFKVRRSINGHSIVYQNRKGVLTQPCGSTQQCCLLNIFPLAYSSTHRGKYFRES